MTDHVSVIFTSALKALVSLVSLICRALPDSESAMSTVRLLSRFVINSRRSALRHTSSR